MVLGPALRPNTWVRRQNSADNARGARVCKVGMAPLGVSFLSHADAARAYVRFALDHPGHYEVMWDRSLYDATDPALVAAEAAAGAELNRGVGTLTDPKAKAAPEDAALAAWALVHGFSLLWLNGAIAGRDAAVDPIETAERIAKMLFDDAR